MRPFPSMTVSFVMGGFRVAVTAMVAGALPQSKVTMPPLATAAESALKVQLEAAPVPTTVVGVEVSTSWPRVGTPVLHEAPGFPGWNDVEPPSVDVLPPSGLPPELEPPEPLLDVVPL